MNAWRPMRASDLPGVEAVAEVVHPGFPEDADVLAERLALYPRGCFALDGAAGLAAYLITHPWRLGDAPKLNTKLGRLPADADCLYIHDLALHPVAQGKGLAGAILRPVLAGAGPFALVAVNGSGPFWERFGFRGAAGPDLRSYGGAAVYMVRG